MENPVFLPPARERKSSHLYYLRKLLEGTQTPDDLALQLTRNFCDVKNNQRRVYPMSKIEINDKKYRTGLIVKGIEEVLKPKRKTPTYPDGQHTVQIVNGKLFVQATENRDEIEVRVVGMGIGNEQQNKNYETGITIKKPFTDWGDGKKDITNLVFFHRETQPGSFNMSRTVTSIIAPERMSGYSQYLAGQILGIYKEACSIDTALGTSSVNFPYLSD